MRRAASRRLPLRRVLPVALILAGCGESGVPIVSMGPDALRSVGNLQLCAAYGEAQPDQRQAVRDEIARRGLLSEREWQAAGQRAIFAGMTACGLLAARGDPRPDGAVERLGVRTGPYLQWVYRSDPETPPLYVYTDNGRIVGWQQ